MMVHSSNRLLKNAHLRRFPHPSSLRRTSKYASGRLTNSSAWQEVAPYSSRRHSQDSGALHLGIFEQPEKITFSATL
jgi:hypothetical protein